MFVRYRKHGHVRYRIRSWFRITDVRYTNPAAYPITDTNRIDPVLYCILPSVRYRIRGWIRITDVRYTKPAAYPITDIDIYICMYYYILPSGMAGYNMPSARRPDRPDGQLRGSCPFGSAASHVGPNTVVLKRFKKANLLTLFMSARTSLRDISNV